MPRPRCASRRIFPLGRGIPKLSGTGTGTSAEALEDLGSPLESDHAHHIGRELVGVRPLVKCSRWSMSILMVSGCTPR